MTHSTNPESQALAWFRSLAHEPSDVPTGYWIAFGGDVSKEVQSLVALLRQVAREARKSERERCAKIVEAYPVMSIDMWDRPGGPPGNGGFRPTRGRRAPRAPARGGSAAPGPPCSPCPSTHGSGPCLAARPSAPG